jgi:hypothetical protein
MGSDAKKIFEAMGKSFNYFDPHLRVTAITWANRSSAKLLSNKSY